ncbi:MAG TPA: peptidylprolyl isomerase [Gaiellaceae bacterium]|nr:peptidylprolyl isomerase [Gaiellaceae bacterium]
MRTALLCAFATLLAVAATATAHTRTASAGCSTVKKPKLGARSGSKSFPKLSRSKTYDVVIATNCGSFTIKLAVRISPHTTASFANLVRRGFFDRTIFHRIVPGFVIQGGDPTGTGLGGPGYTTVDKPPASTQYTLGLVAMAKTPTQAPGTSGSQFFVVTGANVGLSPDYAVLGTVTSGLGVVERIGKLGSASTEQPTRVVEIEKATLHVH